MSAKGRSFVPYRAIGLFLIVSAAVLVPFFLYGEKMDSWFKSFVECDRVNLFVVAAVLFLLLASDIVLPVPSCLVGVSCGYFLGPAFGFAVCFLSMSASAAAGYAIGYYFSGYAEKIAGEEDFAFLKRLHERYGSFLLLTLRSVPVLAEASVLFAGATKHSIPDFIFQVSLGNAIISVVYVATGVLFSMRSEYSFIAFFFCIASSVVLAIGRSRLK